MHFQKQDLEGTHYKWNVNVRKNVFMGEPSRRIFDRFNGDQVLFLINNFGELSESFTFIEGRDIEHEIFNELPGGPKSEISVLRWIKTNHMS